MDTATNDALLKLAALVGSLSAGITVHGPHQMIESAARVGREVAELRRVLGTVELED